MKFQREIKGKLFVISGPAGCGKTTICSSMIEHASGLIDRVVTATTRKPRSGEVDGVDYYFLTEEAFKNKLSEDAFYENALVYGNYYGILKSEIQSKIENKKDLFLSIDVQGVANLAKLKKTDSFLQECMASIFIMPSTLDELKDRLTSRNKDHSDEINKRLKVADDEMQQWESFDYCLLSSSKEEDLKSVRYIYKAEKLKV